MDTIQLDGKNEPRKGSSVSTGKLKKKGYQQKWKIRECQFEKVITKSKNGINSLKSGNKVSNKNPNKQ